MKSLLQSKKTIFIAVLLALVVCCLTVTLALSFQQQEQVAEAATTSVGTASALTSAFSSATSGDIIKLTANITLTSTLNITKAGTYTLDLNGKTLTGPSNTNVIYVKGLTTTFIVQDTSSGAAGKITGGARGICVKANDTGEGVYTTLELRSGNITGNKSVASESNGGGVYIGIGCTFKMSGGTISNNTVTDGNGGGVKCTSSTFTMTGGTISGNSCTTTGGGVQLSAAKFEMSGGKITNNNAGTRGGAIYASMGSDKALTAETVTIKGTAELSNNTAQDLGGAIGLTTGAYLALSAGTITGNKALGSTGGGIWAANYSTVKMTGGTLSSNSTKTNGGGIYGTSNSVINLTGGTITKNTAETGAGGGVYVTSTTGSLTVGGSVTLSQNTASTNGGGIYTNINTTVSGGTISGNTANNGGGIFMTVSTSTLTFGAATITGNTAKANGGGVYINTGTFTMNHANSKIVANNAVLGAGIFMNGGAFNLSNGVIGASGSPNKASSMGGGVYAKQGEFKMSGSAAISYNTATTSGGGVYVVSGATFTMSSSTNKINNNSAANGAGVLTAGAFTMSNGTITANSATTTNGGGIAVVGGSASLALSGGTISSNTSKTVGAGIYIGTSGAKVTMTGGTITANSATTNGGGVYADSGTTFTMSNANAKLTANKAVLGAGVYVNGATFTMSAGYINGANTASTSGGGVYLASGTFTLSGGEITANKATTNGGGVFFKGGTFSLSKAPVVKSNTLSNGTTANNIFIDGSNKLTITSAPTSAANSIGVTRTTDGAITTGTITAVGAFFSDAGNTKRCLGIVSKSLNIANHSVTVWQSDADNHWHKCANCGATDTKTKHGWGAWTTSGTTHTRTCSSNCGVAAQKHTIVWSYSTNGTALNATHTATCTACTDNAVKVTSSHSWSASWTATEKAGQVASGHTKTCSVCKEVHIENHNNASHVTAQVNAVCYKTKSGTSGVKSYSQCTDCNNYFDNNNKFIGNATALAAWKKGDGQILPEHKYVQYEQTEYYLCSSCGSMRAAEQKKLDDKIAAVQGLINTRIAALEDSGTLSKTQRNNLDNLRAISVELAAANKAYQQTEGYGKVLDTLERLLDALELADDITNDTLNQAREEAKAKIDAAAQAAKALVNKRLEDDPNLANYIDQIDQIKVLIDKEAERAKAEIDSAKDDEAGLATTKIDAIVAREAGTENNGALAKLANIELDELTLAVAKEQAKQRIEEAVAKVKAAMEESDQTTAGKKLASNEIDRIVKQAFSDIDAIQINGNLGTAKDAILARKQKAIEDIYATINSFTDEAGNNVLDPSLEAYKDAAKDEIDQARDAAKQAVNQRDGLSNADKQELMGYIEKEADRAKRDIDNATSEAEVDTAKQQGKTNIESLINSALDLAKAKDAAKDAIDQAADDAKYEIDRLKGLTKEQKKAKKAEIDKAAKDAKSSVDKETVTGLLDGIVDGAKEAFDAIVTLEQAKQAAKDIIDKRAQDAKDIISRRYGSKEIDYDEFATLTDLVDQAVRAAYANVDSKTNQGDINEIVNEVAGTKKSGATNDYDREGGSLDDIANTADTKLSQRQTDAKAEIDDAIRKAQSYIRELYNKGLLTEAQRDDLLEKIAALARDGYAAIEGAQSIEGDNGVDALLAKWLQAITDVEDLADKVAEANQAIDEAADHAKEDIKDLKDLSDKERAQYVSQIEAEAAKAKQALVGKTQSDDITAEVTKANSAIEKIVADATLANYKAEANKAIAEAVARATQNVDEMQGLTGSQIAKFKQSIEAKATEAYDKVSQATTRDQIFGIAQEQTAERDVMTYLDTWIAPIDDVVALADTISEANKTIDAETQIALDALDDMAGLDSEQLARLKGYVQTKSNDTKLGFNNDGITISNVESARDNCLKAIVDALTVAETKKDANEQIDDFADKVNETLELMAGLSKDQVDAFKQMVANAIKAAKAAVDAKTIEDLIDGSETVDSICAAVASALTTGEKSFTSIRAFARAISDANLEISDAADEALEKFSELENLSREQIDALTDLVNAIVNATKLAINNVVTNADSDNWTDESVSQRTQLLTAAVNTGKQDINDIMVFADAKSNAINAIDDAVQRANDLIDGRNELSNTEKETLKDIIAKEAERAKKNIDKVTDPESDYSTAIDAIVNEVAGTLSADSRTGGSLETLAQTLADQIAFEKAKEQAKERLEEAADKVKQSIDELVKSGKLGAEEAEGIKENVNSILTEAFAALDADTVTDIAGINSVRDSYLDKIYKIASDVEAAIDVALEKAKNEAKNAIEDAADNAKGVIDGLYGLTEDQKQELKSKIDELAKAAKDKIDNDVEIQSDIDDILNGLLGAKGDNDERHGGALDKFVELEQAKAEAKQEIDQATTDTNARVGERTDLDNDQKAALQDIIRQETERAKSEIDRATTQDEIDDILDRVLGKLNEENNRTDGKLGDLETTEPDDIDLEQKKQDALDELNATVESAKDRVDERVKNGELTPEQGATIKDLIDREAQRAMDEIDSAETEGEIDEVLNRVVGLKDENDNRAGGRIEQIAETVPTGLGLEQNKQDAKDDIDSKAEEAKKDVDKKVENGELTPEEGEKAKEEIDKAAKDAKDAIDKAKSSDQLEKAKKKGLNAINSVINPAPNFEMGWIIVAGVSLVAVIAALALIIVFVKRKSKRE